MRKSIALLLGLSLATLTACGQAPGNSGAASSDAASAVISEAASDAAPATAETPAASSRDTTTEQRNVLDGFVDFSADTAGGSLKCARAAAVLVEYLSCADIDASTAADWMTDLTQDQRDLLDINWAGHFGQCPKHRRRSSQPDRPFILRRCHHGFYRHGFDRGAG